MAPVLLLLGGSSCQLSAARRARELGFRVVLADYTEAPPAAPLVDMHERVSTFDFSACLEVARRHHVSGVVAVGTDQPVYTAAAIAQALSLPSPISVQTALRATNKRAMKEAFAAHAVPNAPHVFVSRDHPFAGDLRAPYVLKPLDSQGQRGVFLLHTPREVMDRLPETLSFSRLSEALVESWYESDELTFSAWLHEGEVYPLALTDREHCADSTHIGVCAAHRYPSVHARLEEEALALSRRVVKALDAREGPLYLQFLLGKKGLIVNEAALRVGGAFEDIFVPEITGFSLLDAALHTAMGLPYAVPQPRDAWPLGVQASVQMLFLRPGQPETRTPEETLRALPGVRYAGYHYAFGQSVPAFSNATARYGYAVLVSGNGDMASLVDSFYQNASVRDAQGQELLMTRRY